MIVGYHYVFVFVSSCNLQLSLPLPLPIKLPLGDVRAKKPAGMQITQIRLDTKANRRLERALSSIPSPKYFGVRVSWYYHSTRLDHLLCNNKNYNSNKHNLSPMLAVAAAGNQNFPTSLLMAWPWSVQFYAISAASEVIAAVAFFSDCNWTLSPTSYLLD